MIRALIADDHNLVRSSIRLLLEHANTIKVEWEATDGLEALEKIRDLQPDVAILDISMPNMDASRSLKKFSNWDWAHRLSSCPCILTPSWFISC